MSEDVSSWIPDTPGQDPDAAEAAPVSDGHGFSDSPHSGYEEEMEADGVGVPAADRVPLDGTGDDAGPGVGQA